MITVPSRISIDQVYYNGLHCLARLDITSTVEFPLLLKLRSNLNTQIAFQVTNENLPEGVPHLFEIATNTFPASTNINRNNHQFNQLFNHVNHVDQIELAPFATRTLILAFLPDPTLLKPTSASLPSDLDLQMHDYLEINGLIFFVCFKDIARMQEATPTLEQKISRNNTETKLQDLLISSPASAVAPPDFQISSKFRSRVCKSLLTTNISTTGLFFEDSIVGGTYFKDFIVQNRSEIELFWTLNTVDQGSHERPCLRFHDYDTGGELDFGCIPAYSVKRVRVTFRPREVGEFNYDLQVENLNDSDNTIETRIHATVRTVLREETLVVREGNLVDFGDCAAGLWKKKTITLRNVSDSSLEVFLSSELGSEVVFQLLPDEVPVEIHLKRSESIAVSDRSHRSVERYDSISRTHSELSVARTASSASSLDSTLLLLDEVEEEEDLSSVGDFEEEDLEEAGEVANIEEMVMRAGTERVVHVCYKPACEATSKFTKKSFKVVLSYWFAGKAHVKEKCVVQCIGRSCTSWIDVESKEVDFGEVDVGSVKSKVIVIKNMSEVEGVVELKYTSKVLSSVRGELLVGVGERREVLLDMCPRKVNFEYEKLIKVTNLLNPLNDVEVTVKSTNTVQDTSIYYQLQPSLVDFGTLVPNSPVIRTFSLSNYSEEDLAFKLRGLEGMEMYTKETPIVTSSGSKWREKVIESIAKPLVTLSSKKASSEDYLDLAGPSRKATVISQPSSMERQDVLAVFERETGSYVSLMGEEEYVLLHQTMKEELKELVREGHLVPLESVKVEVGKTVTIVLVFTHPNSNSHETNIHETRDTHETHSLETNTLETHRLETRLKDKREIAIELIGKEVPTRHLNIKYILSNSKMEIGQKNINFGSIDKTERKKRKIIIRNKSDLPLLYNIKKSGSMASLDLIFNEGRKGVVKGYGKREVEFMFDPTLSGAFQERLTIENIQNPLNNQDVLVKAIIKQQSNFELEKLHLEYGSCLIDHISATTQSIIISNPSSKQARSISIRVDPSETKFPNFTTEILFSSTDLEDPKLALSKENEELIEELEQKLKIAIRKGKVEKEAKIALQLTDLKGANSTSCTRTTTDSKRRLNSITFTLQPREIRSILVHFKPTSLPTYKGDGREESCTARIYVHEEKNRDLIKSVLLRAIICFDKVDLKDVVKEEEVESVGLEVDRIDLGRLVLGERRECYFNLTSRILTTMKLTTQDEAVKCEKYISLKGEGVDRVEITLTPLRLGSNVSKIVMESSSGSLEVTFVYHVVRACYIDLNSPLLVQGDLELGDCFIDPLKRFAKVVPLTITNISKEAILLSAMSNLMQQCILFQDETLSNTNVDGLFIPGEASIVIYVALQPGLQVKESRTLIGGLRFTISVAQVTESHKMISTNSTYIQVSHTNLRFTAVIGRSVMHVDTCVLRMKGRVGQVLEGDFEVKNMTLKMPLMIHLVASPLISLVTSPSTVVTNEGEMRTIQTTDRVFFHTTLLTSSYTTSTIILSNLNNTTQLIVLSVFVFGDAEVVKTEGDVEYGEVYVDEDGWLVDGVEWRTIELESLVDVDMVVSLSSTLSLLFHSDPNCGFEVALKAKEKVQVRVGIERVKEVLDEVILVKSAKLDVVGVVKVKGSPHVSLARLESLMVDVGRIGYENKFEPVQFDLKVLNESQINLKYHFVLPQCIQLVSNIDDLVTFRLDPLKCSSEGFATLTFINDKNAKNNFDILIAYTLTQFEVIFDRSELIMPLLTYPLSPSLDSLFTIINTSDHEITYPLTTTLSDGLSSYITLLTLTKTSLPLTTLTLPPQSSIEVKVKMTVKECRMSADSWAYVGNSKGILLGSVKVGEKELAVRGVVKEGFVFEVGCTTLIFNTSQSLIEGNIDSIQQSLSITNLSHHLTLKMNVLIEYPIEVASFASLFKVLGLDQDGTLTILPDTTTKVTISLPNSQVYGVSEDVRVHIIDTESVTRKLVTVPIKFVEEEIDVELKGCKKVSQALFDLDLGQVDLNVLTVRKLSLECQWVLNASRTDKWLHYAQVDGGILLTLQASLRGSFVTYLIIGKKEGEVKFIRISIEVVSKNVRRNTSLSTSELGLATIHAGASRLFDVYTSSLTNSTEIDMAALQYDKWYDNYSFTIFNRELVEMDYVLSSSLTSLHGHREYELAFSTSRFNGSISGSVRVEAESQVVIYVRLYFPSPLHTQPTASLSVVSEEKEIEVYINCRLIKDFQRVVSIKAVCSEGQMDVDRARFEFRLEGLAVASAGVDQLSVRNKHSSTLNLVVMVESAYFYLSPTNSSSSMSSMAGRQRAGSRHEYSIEANQRRNFKVSPNMALIARDIDALRRQRYLQTYIIIYNRDNLSEKIRISVKLSSGFLEDFNILSDPYTNIEAQITDFLSGLHLLPTALTTSDLPFSLLFQYRYLTDQLTFHLSKRFLVLASLLFMGLFRGYEDLLFVDEVWVMPLVAFVQSVQSGLGYEGEGLEVLRKLAESF